MNNVCFIFVRHSRHIYHLSDGKGNQILGFIPDQANNLSYQIFKKIINCAHIPKQNNFKSIPTYLVSEMIESAVPKMILSYNEDIDN